MPDRATTRNRAGSPARWPGFSGFTSLEAPLSTSSRVTIRSRTPSSSGRKRLNRPRLSKGATATVTAGRAGEWITAET